MIDNSAISETLVSGDVAGLLLMVVRAFIINKQQTLRHADGNGSFVRLCFSSITAADRRMQLLKENNQAVSGLIRKKAIKLTLSGAREAADLLSSLPFQYWAGTNSFGDQLISCI